MTPYKVRATFARANAAIGLEIKALLKKRITKYFSHCNLETVTMRQSQKAILFVLLAVSLVAFGHRLRAAKTFVAADRYEAAAQKMRPFLKAGSRMNLTGNLSGIETLLPCRNAFFPVLLFPEKEIRLDTVLWVHAKRNSLPAGNSDTSDAQKVLCRYQDDSNLYVLMIR